MKYLLKRVTNTTVMTYADMTKDAWSSLIANPPVIPDKKNAPLAIWGIMKDEVARDPVDGYPRCIGDNVAYMYALQIDVDNGCSIDRFVGDYHRYKFDLYTSYSYGYKQGDRYRVIFPLRERLRIEWLVPPVKQYLVELFPMSDSTCFDRGHFQILPCIKEKEAPYRYIRHDGELLSFACENFANVAEEYKDDAHWRREISEADRDPNANHSGALRKAQELISNAVEGERNRTMWSTLCWLKSKVGADYGEAVSLVPPIGMENEFRGMVARLFG